MRRLALRFAQRNAWFMLDKTELGQGIFGYFGSRPEDTRKQKIENIDERVLTAKI